MAPKEAGANSEKFVAKHLRKLFFSILMGPMG